MSQNTPPNVDGGQYGNRGQYGGQGQHGTPGQYGERGAGSGGGAQPEPVEEMAVSRPTLRWVSVTHPHRPVPVGDDDYVLDSYFDPQYGTWEVLVLVRPTEDEEEEEE